MNSDSLIVLFDENGNAEVYESTADIEAGVEPTMAAEEPYEVFTMNGFVVELSFRGNLASNATPVATVTSRQDIAQLQKCLARVGLLDESGTLITDVESLVNALWAREWARQQRAWWNFFRKHKLPTKPRTVQWAKNTQSGDRTGVQPAGGAPGRNLASISLR